MRRETAYDTSRGLQHFRTVYYRLPGCLGSLSRCSYQLVEAVWHCRPRKLIPCAKDRVHPVAGRSHPGSQAMVEQPASAPSTSDSQQTYNLLQRRCPSDAPLLLDGCQLSLPQRWIGVSSNGLHRGCSCVMTHSPHISGLHSSGVYAIPSRNRRLGNCHCHSVASTRPPGSSIDRGCG